MKSGPYMIIANAQHKDVAPKLPKEANGVIHFSFMKPD